MKVHTVIAGYFKLDGGAMHGVVPKVMWQKVNPADDTNMCPWAMRCLLIEHEGRLILVDNGMGDKQETLRSRHPKRDEPALVSGMIGIVERLGKRIEEDRFRFLERDIMLAEVLHRLLDVPLADHGLL